MNKNVVLNIWFIYLTFYICFKHFFVNDNFMYLILSAIFLLVIIYGIFINIKIKRNLWWSLHAILVLDMFFSSFYTTKFDDAIKFTVVYLLFLIVSFWFTQISNWQQLFLKWLKYGCLIHLGFTLFSILFTEKALKISSVFLSDEAQSLTIRWAELHHYAGISGQTGTNALFFSILIGIFASEICALKRKKILLNVLFLSSWIGLFYTGRKGSVIASVFSLIALLWLSNDKKNQKKVLILVNIIVVCFIFISIVFNQKIYYLFYNSLYTRNRLINGMISAIKKAPLLGNGVNSVSNFTYEQHLGHNIYLQIWVEQGIIGLILLLSACLLVLYLTYMQIEKKTLFCKEEKTYIYFSLFIQFFVLIYGCFENPIYEYNTLIVYFLSIASGFADNTYFFLHNTQINKLKR